MKAIYLKERIKEYQKRYEIVFHSELNNLFDDIIKHLEREISVINYIDQIVEYYKINS